MASNFKHGNCKYRFNREARESFLKPCEMYKIIFTFLIAVLFVSIFAAHPAYATGFSFNSTKNLSNTPTNDSYEEQVVVSGSNVYVVWVDNNGGTVDVFFAKSTDGGTTFGATINLSNDPGESVNPRLAVSGSNVYVTWQDNPGGPTDDIYFAKSADGGTTFSAAVNISNNSGASAAPQIAVSGTNVYLVWDDTTSGHDQTFFAASSNSGSSFGTPVNISNDAGSATSQQIAVSGTNVYLVWDDTTSGHDQTFFAASSNSGSSFGTPVNISNDAGSATIPQIAATGSAVFLTWKDHTPGNDDIFFAASSNSGSSFGTPVNISNDAGISTTPEISVSGTNVYIVWSDNTPGNNDIFFAASSNSGSSFGTPVNISNNTGISTSPQISSSGTNVYIVWSDNTPGNNDIFFKASVDSGNTFGGFTDLSNNSGASTAPEVASSGNNVYVSWLDDTGTSGIRDAYFIAGSSSNSTTDIEFDTSQYKIGKNATITVNAPSANNPSIIDSISVHITSTSDSTGITVTMRETGINTGIFTGQISLSSASSLGSTLHVSAGDTITASYGGQIGTAFVFPRIVSFDFSDYSLDKEPIVTVTDQNSNLDPTIAETIQVHLSSTSNPSGTEVQFTETGPNTGVFQPTRIVLSNGNDLFTIGSTATVTQSDTVANNPNVIDTITVQANSTTDNTGIPLTLTETGKNTAFFTGKLNFTTSPSSGNSLQVANGDLIGVTYQGALTRGMIIPNPNPGVGLLQALIGDTISASYQGASASATIIPGSGGGGGGGGVVRPGLVLDILLTLGESGVYSDPPSFVLDPASLEKLSMPKNILDNILSSNSSQTIPSIPETGIELPFTIDGKGYPLQFYANEIQTNIESTGKPVNLRLSINNYHDIIHVSLFTNLSGKQRDIQDSDTAIIYDEGKPLMIVDPHGLFSNVTMAKSVNGTKSDFMYNITFAKPMDKSDIIIRTWNDIKSSTDVKILDAWEVVNSSEMMQNKTIMNQTIPNKTNSTTLQLNIAQNQTDILSVIKEWGGYSSMSISDADLLKSIGINGSHIPPWLMKTTKWLVNGQTTQQQFVDEVKYLHKQGIIK